MGGDGSCILFIELILLEIKAISKGVIRSDEVLLPHRGGNIR